MERRQIVSAAAGPTCGGGVAMLVAGLVNDWPLAIGAGVILLLLGLFAYLGLFLSVPRAPREPPAWAGSNSTPVPPPTPLVLEVGEAGELVRTKGSNMYSIERAFILRVSNADASRSIRHCKVRITDAAPPGDYVGPWLLAESFDLPAGDHQLVPLASYGEAREPTTFNSADSFVRVLLKQGQLTLDIDKESTLTIRATGDDVPFAEMQCRLWIDETGHFRIAAS